MTAEPDRTEPAAATGSEPAPHPGCPVAWCPVCMAVSMAQPLHPEVFDHLLKAGTEMLLAARALLDVRARAAGAEEPTGPTRLEKIDLG